MKGTAQLGLEGKLDFIRERSRVGLAEGTACEKNRGLMGQAQEAVNNMLGPEWCIWNGGVSKEQPGIESEGIKNSGFRLIKHGRGIWLPYPLGMLLNVSELEFSHFKNRNKKMCLPLEWW